MATLMTLMSQLTLNTLPFRRELGKVASVTKSQSNMMGKVMMGAGATAAVGVGLMTAATVKLAVEGTKLAARNEMLATSLEVVGSNAGWEAEELYKAVDAVKEKGITTAAATTAVTRFIQSQLALGKSTSLATDEISKLARVSQDLAVVAGVNSSEAMQTLMQATTSLRPMLVKQFGIVDGLQVIYKTYADSVGKAAVSLTEAEKRQAFLNRIFLEGEKVAGAYEAAMGTVGKQLTSLPRYAEEGKVAIGEIFLPIMGAGVSILTDFWEAVIRVAPALKEKLTPAVERFAEGMLNFQASVASTLDWFKSNWEAIFSAAAAVLIMTVVPSLGLLTTALGVAYLALEKFIVAQAVALGPIALVAAAIYVLVKAFQALQIHQEAVNAQNAATEQSALMASVSYEQYASAVVAAHRESDTFMAKLTDTQARLYLQQNALLKSEHAWNLLSDSVGKSFQEFTKVHTEISKFGEAPEILGNVASAAVAVTQELDGMAIAAANMGAAYVEALGSDKVQKALSDLQSMMETHASETIKIEDSALRTRAADRWKFEVDQRIKTAKYHAEMEQMRSAYLQKLAMLQAAGNAQAAAELTTAYTREVATSQHHFTESQTMAEWNAKVQAQIDERGLLEQKVVRAREYVEQLKLQHKAITDSLRLAIESKTGQTRIEIETGKALLRVLGISQTEMLVSKVGYAETALEIEKQIARGTLTSAQAQINAIAALRKAMDGATAEGQAALDAAQAALDAFEIQLPPLDLPPAPTWDDAAEEYGAKTEEVTQKIAFDMVSGMARAVSAAKQAISDLIGLKIPEGFNKGLDVFESASVQLANRFHSIWSKLQDKLEDAAKGAEGLTKIAQSVQSLVGGIVAIEGLDLDVPWLTHLAAFVSRTTQLLDAMIPKLRELNAKWKDDLDLLETWAEATGALSAILSAGQSIIKATSANLEDYRLNLYDFFYRITTIMRVAALWVMAERDRTEGLIDNFKLTYAPFFKKWSEALKDLNSLIGMATSLANSVTDDVATFGTNLYDLFWGVKNVMHVAALWVMAEKEKTDKLIDNFINFYGPFFDRWAQALKGLGSILGVANSVTKAASEEAVEVLLVVSVLFDRVVEIMDATKTYLDDTEGLAGIIDRFVTESVPTLEKWALALKPLADVLSIGQGLLGTASTKAAEVALEVDTMFDRVWKIAEAVTDWVDNKGEAFKAKLTALLDPESGLVATIDDLIDVLTPISRLLKVGKDLLSSTTEEAETVKLDFIALLDDIWEMALEIGAWVTNQGPTFAADVAALKLQLVTIFTDLVDTLTPVETLMKTVADAVKAAESVSEGQLDSAFNQRLIPAIKNVRLSLSNLYAELVQMDLTFMPDLNDRMTKLNDSLSMVLDAIADIGRSDVTESPTALLDEFKESLRDALSKAEGYLEGFHDYLSVTFLGHLTALDYGPATTGVIQTIIDASSEMEGDVYAAGFSIGSSWRDGVLSGLGGAIPLPSLGGGDGGGYGESGGRGGNTINLTANYPYQDKTSLKDTVQLLQAGYS